MQRKIFHISQDEKFIKLAKYQFNTLYGELNTYYIVVKNKVKPLNFVQKDNQTKVVERGELSLLSHEIPKNSIIVFHSIIPHFYSFINNLPSCHTLIWIFFGMEIYNDEKLYKRKELYAPLTYKLSTSKKGSKLKQLKHLLRPYIRFINTKLPYDKLEEIIEAILNSYFSIQVSF